MYRFTWEAANELGHWPDQAHWHHTDFLLLRGRCKSTRGSTPSKRLQFGAMT